MRESLSPFIATIVQSAYSAVTLLPFSHGVSDPVLNTDYHKPFDAPDDHRGIQVSMASVQLEKPKPSIDYMAHLGFNWDVFGGSDDSDDSESGIYVGW